jgi:hypothetical protein
MRETLVERGVMERLFLIAGALRSGVVDVLAAEGPATAAEVAAMAGTDLRATELVLQALESEGLVSRDGSLPAPPLSRAADGSDRVGDHEARYTLTPLAREHLVDPGPNLERWGLLHQARKAWGWLDLPEIIKTGQAPPRDPTKREIKTMVSAMGERDPAIVEEVVDTCLRYTGTIETMIDVAGAVGHVARQFSRCGVRATLFDRPAVMPVAEEYLGADAKDIALIGGDLTVALPPGPFDLVFFGNVLHIYSPEIDARVIRAAFATVSPGGAIAVQNYLWGRSRRAAMFSVNMLQSAENGGVWSESMYRGWLTDAGFAKIETFDLETGESQLLLAIRPPAGTGD